MRIEWSPEAERDLNDLCDHVAQDNPPAASRVGARIFVASLELAHFPLRGRPGRVDGTRELVIPSLPWQLIYAVSEDRVEILRVLHGARFWPPPPDNDAD